MADVKGGCVDNGVSVTKAYTSKNVMDFTYDGDVSSSMSNRFM